jgi:GNAT superfamily N-acetyltransferase
MRPVTDIADLLSTASTIGRLGPYEITDDPDRVSIDVVHEFLSRHSPAGRGVAVDRVERCIRMSLPLSVHLATCTPSTVGLLRVVTDTVTRSRLEDLFVLREHRRRGIAGALVRAALTHPAVSGTTTTVECPPAVLGLFTGLGFRPIVDTGARRLATDRAPGVRQP